jgi:tetratricopeptide (TPR) repeat protein
VRALQRHEYAPAADGLRRLLTDFPTERALLDRAQVYLDLCERELRRRPAAPQTIEERLTAATAALNNGDDDEAETLAHGVLSESPEHDLALYLLAAVYGRRGNRSQALDLLRRAMHVSPDIRAQARHDADFEILREMHEFQELLDSPAGSSGPNGRRLRRGRPER